MSSVLLAAAGSVVFGLMWDLPDVVPLISSEKAALAVAANISWWFQNVFGILSIGIICLQIVIVDRAGDSTE
jgi:hypothetical protein